ncbi:BlaI/MecI/CopY family transcriptional regulator [Microbacterium bovistercoris]|uniref:BlaI/MecI/CopY family transcriptional regulator n=1 Tax=Microbacterium bovistercoris TaxID=2293570 RepID=A0A371NQS4_9MICO|nr:BlaI/MecI/CopY family transcriptional regulator [Microbacterium bovistercoris]REJ04512.1 BlaI/MecI/CopY family transcriptional regulator [Microbacterium bovistercoris]
MGTLGELERAVMDAIWDSSGTVTAYDVQDVLQSQGRTLAATTVLTVLARLEKKGFVVSDRSARPHRYSALASRADHTAELMHEVLGGAGDRTAVLARFVGGVSAEDAAVLRRLLDSAA